ncbi:hypothetical protein LF1_04820 [Rubripirellula obstinata]|uniref:Uncharacterized protein n=1 Tax=Rubripirellula obstinata TaxID=406547 RepID=A0A5B1CCM4_9BACT|nr:hypothetical protein LF1_04820 [Rubripirellula obstinata]
MFSNFDSRMQSRRVIPHCATPVPFRQADFAHALAKPFPITSHLQTYLDLMTLEGRGEEAAKAIYDEHLGPCLESADHAGRSLE